jgi:FkbM family methyltransferase
VGLALILVTGCRRIGANENIFADDSIEVVLDSEGPRAHSNFALVRAIEIRIVRVAGASNLVRNRLPEKHQWLGKLMLRSPAPIRALRNLPVVGGLIHIVSHRLVRSDERVWAEIEAGPGKGLWFELNPRTGQHYLRGQAETVIQKILVELLREGMVFYDLGANIGLFSLLAARLVGSTGRVISFEPDPETAVRLERNIARNGYHNLTVIQAGVWSTTGTRRFKVADASSPDHGVGRFAAEDADEKDIAVECVALDDIAMKIAAPDAIKCDVEGAEIEVLLGAKRILLEHRPWIVCELHSGANRIAAGEILKQFNYCIETIDDNHFLALPDAPLE